MPLELCFDLSNVASLTLSLASGFRHVSKPSDDQRRRADISHDIQIYPAGLLLRVLFGLKDAQTYPCAAAAVTRTEDCAAQCGCSIKYILG